MTQLVRVDHRVDALDPGFADLERHHADQPPLAVERHGAGLTVDLGAAQLVARLLRERAGAAKETAADTRLVAGREEAWRSTL